MSFFDIYIPQKWVLILFLHLLTYSFITWHKFATTPFLVWSCSSHGVHKPGAGSSPAGATAVQEGGWQRPAVQGAAGGATAALQKVQRAAGGAGPVQMGRQRLVPWTGGNVPLRHFCAPFVLKNESAPLEIMILNTLERRRFSSSCLPQSSAWCWIFVVWYTGYKIGSFLSRFVRIRLKS